MLETIWGAFLFLVIIVGGIASAYGLKQLVARERGYHKYLWSPILLGFVIAALLGCFNNIFNKKEAEITNKTDPLVSTAYENGHEGGYSLGLYDGAVQAIENAKLVEVGDDYYIISYFGEEHYYTK